MGKMGMTVDMAHFFEEWPIHCVMYELDSTKLQKDDKRHLESRKRHFLDIMFWSNFVKCPSLPSRYVFADAPADLERFSAAHLGGNAGSNMTASMSPRSTSSPPMPSASSTESTKKGEAAP